MASILSAEERAFLKKIEEQKDKHKQAQAKYRANKQEEIKKYNQKYNEEKRARLNEINKKIIKAPPTPINVKKIQEEPPKVDKRTRRGKKQTPTTTDKTPSYQTRKEPLEYSTIDDYIKKANIINKIFNKKDLSPQVKAEIKKMLNDNANINEPLILNEMTYINGDIEPTITLLRDHYKNDNTFKAYINVLTVITGHLKSINESTYQTLTKTNIYINNKVQDRREDNEIEEGDEEKIIDLEKPIILKNLHQLKNINDMLIYGLYCLFPCRRLEWRNVILTTETDYKRLESKCDNYLIISTYPKQIVFNDYKTYKTYGQQIFDIDDDDLNNIIDSYIKLNDLKPNDYLFHLQRDKREVINEPTFSQKISNVFKKVYGVPISIRYIRMSWSTYINSQNISIKKKKILIEMMAHSYAESQKYFKLLNVEK